MCTFSDVGVCQSDVRVVFSGISNKQRNNKRSTLVTLFVPVVDIFGNKFVRFIAVYMTHLKLVHAFVWHLLKCFVCLV